MASRSQSCVRKTHIDYTASYTDDDDDDDDNDDNDDDDDYDDDDDDNDNNHLNGNGVSLIWLWSPSNMSGRHKLYGCGSDDMYTSF